MNLTVRASLEGLMGRATSLSGTMKSRLEQTQELTEALDCLQAAQQTGRDLMAMMDDLFTAKESLESCGFSQEWLDTINADGRFLEAVSIDLVDLLGSDEEKTKVAMEGIWSSIWNFIKKIWEFIVNIFNKVVGFVKKWLGILRGDGDMATKATKIIAELQSAGDSAKVAQALGEAIHKKYGANGKYPDLRGLITRTSVCQTMTMYILNKYEEIFGVKNPDKNTGAGFFDTQFRTYAVDSLLKQNAPKENYFFREMLSAINHAPDSVVAINGTIDNHILAFRDFTCIADAKDLKALMRDVGIDLIQEGNKITFSIDQLEKSVLEIDYRAVYTDTDNYARVMAEYEKQVNYLVTRGVLNMFQGKCDDIRDFAQKAYNFAASHNANTTTGNVAQDRENLSLRDAFTCEGRWFSEIASEVTRLITTMNTCLNAARKITDVIVTEGPKIKKEITGK